MDHMNERRAGVLPIQTQKQYKAAQTQTRWSRTMFWTLYRQTYHQLMAHQRQATHQQLITHHQLMAHHWARI